MQNLVLASTSRYRRDLLARLEVPFISAAPAFDERAEDARFGELGAEAFALRLAMGKARSLRDEHPDAWILGADQVAVGPGGELLHKPGSEERAIAQLMRLSGAVFRLVTGVVLLDASGGDARTAVDVQTLTMRSYGEEEAATYVRRHRPLDCAGSFRIEDAGIKLFTRIDGADFTGIIGLPLIAVAGLLRDVGLLPGP
ncbi:Maf family protein [Nannocystis pusilla]|uniref:7-methyl-GTP pyrophosphatase n=1 Tax=Nannocystis pusilla TaxID=889268 RepID=A0ABS7TNJ2_9BACT|nr:nucleoside triphosphate pyrophosphatase [Nannocystis pusilla]MBZ5709799.1 Maf family nucleotide pyrophosphatase [Nannocystis pusilla]